MRAINVVPLKQVLLALKNPRHGYASLADIIEQSANRVYLKNDSIAYICRSDVDAYLTEHVQEAISTDIMYYEIDSSFLK